MSYDTGNFSRRDLHWKQTGSMNDLYLIGEDFEAILDYLENDGDLEEQ